MKNYKYSCGCSFDVLDDKDLKIDFTLSGQDIRHTKFIFKFRYWQYIFESRNANSWQYKHNLPGQKLFRRINLFGYYNQDNKKIERIPNDRKVNYYFIIGSNEDRVDLELSEDVKGYLPMKDYTNSMSDTPLEVGTEIEVVIANINSKDREIILSLRALEKQEEKSALKDNALKNKEIEEATKSNIGDLIKAEMQDADKEDE